MKSIQFTTLFLAILVLLSCSSNDDNDINQDENRINTTEKLTAYFNELASTKEVPGFAINIVKNNSLLYQEAFGYANISNQKLYTNNTLTSIASVSKTFVAAATMKAIEQGLFTLETDINSLIPVEIINPKQSNSSIKIKHLLTHTSGIVDVPETYIAANYFIKIGENTSTTASQILMNNIGIQQTEKVALEDYLAEVFLEDGDLYTPNNFLDAKPGEQWMYSNTATALLSYIIQTKANVSFVDFVSNNILNPLQMSNSSYDVNQLNTSDLATYYMNPSNAFPRYGNHTLAEGSMHTTNIDFGNYLLEMTKGASGNAPKLFSPYVYQQLFSNQFNNTTLPNEFADHQGLFWYAKGDKLMHGGNSFGVSTHIQLDANGESGFTIISNMDGTFVENGNKWEEVKLLISNAIAEYLTYK